MSRRKQAAPRPIKQIHSELFEDFDNEHGNDHEVKIKEEPLSDSDEFLDEDDDDYDDEEDGNWVIAEDEGSDENFEGNGKYDESLDAANEEDEHKITIETGDSLETEESSEAKDKNSEEDSLEGGSSQFGWSYTYKDGRPMCRYCGRSFMSIGGLKIHSHRCREEKAKRIKEQQPANPNLQCWKCKAIFSTRSSMKRHEKKCGKLYFRSRPMRDMGTTRCNYCKKEFLTRSLMKHLSRCKWLTNSQLKMQYRRVILPKGSDPSRGEITPGPVNSNPSPTSTTAPSKAPKGPTAPIKIAPAQSNSNTPAGSIQSTPGQQPIGALPQLSPALVMAAPGSQPVQYIMPVASSAMASSGNTTSPIFVLANVGTNVPAGSVIASNVVPASSNVTNILPSGMTASGMTTLVPVTMVSTTIANVSPSTTKGTAATRVLSATTVKSPTSVTNIAATSVTNVLPAKGTATPIPAASTTAVALPAGSVARPVTHAQSPTLLVSAAGPSPNTVTTTTAAMSSAPTQQMVIPAFGQPGQVIQSWQQNQIPNQPAKLVLPKEFGVQQMSSQGSAIKPKEPPNVSSAIALPKKQGTSDNAPNLPRRSPRRHSSKIHENEGTDSQEKIPVVMPATSVSGKVAIPRLSRPIGGRILIQPLQPHRIQAARTRQTSTALQQIKPKPIETASSQEKRVVVDMKSMMKVREVSLLFQDKPQGVFASPVEVRRGNESVQGKKKLPRRVTVKDLVAHKNSKRARLDESVENSKMEEDDEQVEDDESSDQGEENATEPQNTVVIDGKPREIKLEPASPPTEQVTDTQGAEDVKKDSMEEEVYIGVSIKEEKKDDDADVKPEEDVRQENDGEEKKQSDEGEKDDVMKSQDRVENLAVDESSQKEVVSEENKVKQSDHTLKRRYRVIAPKPVAGESFSDSEEDVSDIEEGEEMETNRPEGLPKTTKVRKNPIRHADGQLECEECGRLFKSIRNYNRHYPSHIDDKRFKCTICSKTFHLSYHLKEHMNKHYDLRPYKCHLCGKAYNHSGTLSGHLKMAHKNESIPLRDIMKCTYCCKVFAYEGTYYKHLEDRHNVTVQRFYTPPTPGSWQTVTSVPVGLPRGRLGGNKKNIPQTSDAPTELPVQNYQYVSTEGKSDKPHINPLPQRVSKKRRAMRLAGKLRDEDERTSEGIPIFEKVGIPNSFALMQQPYYQNDPKYRAILPRPTVMANQSLDGKVTTESAQPAQPASDIGTQPGTAMAIQSSVSASVPVSTTSPTKVVAATASSVTPVTSSVSDSTTPVQSTSTEFTCKIGDSAQTDASSKDATSAVPQSPSLTDSVLKQEDEGTSQDTDTEDQIIESSTKPKENTVTIKQRHYSCHYCPVSFSTKLRLSFHVTKEHSSRPMNSITHQKKVAAMAKFGGTSKLVIAKYRCVLCLYFFRDLPTLRRHISNFHRCVNPDMFVADIIQEQEDLSHRNALECYSASTGRKLSTPRSVSAEPESESESKADSNDNREVSVSAAQGQSVQPTVDSFPKCYDENKILSSIIAESRHVDVKKEKIVSTSDSSSDTKIHVGKEPITGALSTSNQLVNSEKSQLATSQQAFDGQSDHQKGEASVPYVGQTVIGNQPSAESNNQTETSHNTMLCLFPLHCATDNIFNCRTVIQQCPMCNWTFICKVRKDLRVLSVNSLTVKHMCPSCMQRFEYGFAHMDDESDFFCRKCCPQSRNKRKPKRYVVVDGTVREDSSEEDENDKISENSHSSDLEDTSEDRISPMGIVGVESFPFQCKKCKVKFYEEVDTNKVLCTTCNKFVTRASLREHTQMHEFEAAPKSPPPEEATVEPDKCRICYRKVKDFETHMKMSHRTIHDAQQELKHQQDTGIYSCSQCNQAYLLRGNLHRHINMYHSNKSETEKCQVAKCGKVFQSASHLEMHMKNTHNTETNIQDQEDTQSTT